MKMENGRRKISICLVSIVLAAVVIGICYYYSNREKNAYDSEGILIRQMQEDEDVC